MSEGEASGAGRDGRGASGPWTTRRLLEWMRQRFQAKGLPSPRLAAEMLLCHVLGCERMRLYMDVDRPASGAELDALRPLVVRASNHEPVDYLVGRRWFFSREFAVDRCTMIPQPCTEDLVSHVIEWFRDRAGQSSQAQHAEPGRGPLIADIGTGTGCIAVSLAAELDGVRLLATDVVPEALALARRNAERHGVADRIVFVEGSLLEPLGEWAQREGEQFSAICSNPPYISDVEWEGGAVERSVREFVPARAVRAGPDGLDCIRPLVAGAGRLLRPGGLLALEIGARQREPVVELAQAVGLCDVRVLKDLEGRWRVLLGEKGRG